MKRSNIAEFGCGIDSAVPDSAISFGSDQPMPPENIRKVCVATCMTLRIPFGGNTFADEGNGLFVFQSGGIFVQAFCFPFFEPCLFF